MLKIKNCAHRRELPPSGARWEIEFRVSSLYLNGAYETAKSFIDGLPELESLQLDLCDYERLLPEALTRNSAVLTTLTFNVLPVEKFYAVVTGCPALQERRVNALQVVGSEPSAS
ncbi:hypothetical protein BGZ93_006411 [Podila epicladia]|nr:hypothetical protein BGZ93_006411 [Podila epicladia]